MSIRIEVRQKTEVELKIRELNHRSTDLKDVDINESIDCLYEVKQLREGLSTGHEVVGSYLKLPVYLQKAGRFKESVDEFKDVIKQFKAPYDRKIIFDKMRMCYQREKRFDDAVEYGVASLAYEWMGIQERTKHAEKDIQRLLREQQKARPDRKDFYQGLIDSAEERLTQDEQFKNELEDGFMDNLQDNILKLLKKAKKPDKLSPIFDEMCDFIEASSISAVNHLRKRTKEIVKNNN